MRAGSIPLGQAVVLRFETAGTWQAWYEFTLARSPPEDYILTDSYRSHTPDSFFVPHVLRAKPTTEGRVMLLDRQVKIRAQGKTRHSTDKLPDDFRTLRKGHFGIEQAAIPGGVAQNRDRRGA